MRLAFAYGIGLYQRHLSAHKGFCCAHHHLHKRGSCSEFAKRAVLKFGLFRLMPLLRLRFAACRRAYVALSEMKADEQAKGKQENANESDSFNPGYCVTEVAANVACCALSP